MYYQGDYYQGDPGLFGSIWGGIKKVGGLALDVVSSVNPVAGAVRGAVRNIARQPAPRQQTFTGTYDYGRQMQIPATIQPPRLGAGTAGKSERSRAAMGLPKKRRRMNVTNDKALRRAVRRTDGFVKLAKRALRGTGYTVVSKSSRARKVNVRESGAGSVTVH